MIRETGFIQKYYHDYLQNLSRVHKKELGLGFTSKKIVEAHDGKIWAENGYKNNQITGSRFTMILPCTT